jgi:hypothetical protein
VASGEWIVQADAHDGHVREGSTDWVDTDYLKVGKVGTDNHVVGIWFANTTGGPPAGTTITSAELVVEGAAGDGNSNTWWICIEDGATGPYTSHADWVSRDATYGGSGNVGSCTLVPNLNSAGWISGADVELDITATVQAWIDSAGYSQGDGLNVDIQEPAGATNDNLWFDDYGSGGAKAPRLRIVWPSSPTVNHTADIRLVPSGTQRSKGDLMDLLRDNTMGDISAMDVRDIVDSMQLDHGEMYISSSSETTINTQDVWEAVAGTWMIGADFYNFAMDTNGQLKYTGPTRRMAMLTASISMTAAQANKTFEVAIAKNGTVHTPSIIRRKIGVAGDVGAAAAHALVHLETDDYVSLVVRNTTDASNVTINLSNLVAMSHLH